MTYLGLTAYHAKLYAHELMQIHASDDPQKFIASISDAQVNLTPHQIDAALFAFKSPLSKGAILADEVGLGKTIEAGIILSQKWAERKRRILIISPANLRKQWSQELADKFFLPSFILEGKQYKSDKKIGITNPFDRKDEIVICSFQFAAGKQQEVMELRWDMVIIDEAHRLRNVYKSSNRIGRAIKTALHNAPKILLTATPLQNSLLELYGLVSIVDEHVFGDLKSFKAQFARLSNDTDSFTDLRDRIKPICQRTLRRQVLEYVPYTNRHAMVESYVPYSREQRLYDFVTEYLQRDNLYALPNRQRQLMTLILRKLLASSTFAIAGTLEALENKLRTVLSDYADATKWEESIETDYESLTETEEEWGEEEYIEGSGYDDSDIALIKAEADDLAKYKELAKSIKQNAKGDILLKALDAGFEKIRNLGGAHKAIIFTESTRTQKYLYQLLEGNGFEGQCVLFNGKNDDAKSKDIYLDWIAKHKDTDRISGSRPVDIRAALVDYFRDEAVILIATEAAAEGINLQFCSLLVNYDLPWNPQRIEQRIGRCHRYGQKHDVVVLNFLNKNNAADQRVYTLLSQKFRLFEGVFGASDEVLGSLESGVDFEKRIAAIYQKCRNETEIKEAFDELQSELETDISTRMKNTRRKLLENFDEEVRQKLKMRHEEAKRYLNAYEEKLWNLTRWYLQDHATFNQEQGFFQLDRNPFSTERIHPGPYRMGERTDTANVYRVHHPLAQRILESCKEYTVEPQKLTFDYTAATNTKISVLESFLGQSGHLRAERLLVESADTEEFLLLTAYTKTGESLSPDLCMKLFSLPATVTGASPTNEAAERVLVQNIAVLKDNELQELAVRNSKIFDSEMEKYDKWAEDCKRSLEKEIGDLDNEIKLRKMEARKMIDLESKISEQRKVKKLEKLRNEKRQTLYSEQDAINDRKDELLDKVQAQLSKTTTQEHLFSIEWELK